MIRVPALVRLGNRAIFQKLSRYFCTELMRYHGRTRNYCIAKLGPSNVPTRSPKLQLSSNCPMKRDPIHRALDTRVFHPFSPTQASSSLQIFSYPYQSFFAFFVHNKANNYYRSLRKLADNCSYFVSGKGTHQCPSVVQARDDETPSRISEGSTWRHIYRNPTVLRMPPRRRSMPGPKRALGEHSDR